MLLTREHSAPGVGVGTLYFTIAGSSWVVERRLERVAAPFLTHSPDERLFLVFAGATGEIRRGEIADSFPEDPSAELLALVWRNAEVVRAGSPGEMRSRGELVLPRWRDVARLTWRAFRMRCPHCGIGDPLHSWFRLRHACPACGLRLDRGEDEDYYLGGMFFNIMVSETIFAAAFGVVVALLWPDVPWDDLEYALIGAMVVVPIAFYPVSRLLWLALDLLLRPPDETEMRWHVGARAEPPDD